MSDVLEKGQCGHFCEACARRDDKIAKLEAWQEFVRCNSKDVAYYADKYVQERQQ